MESVIEGLMYASAPVKREWLATLFESFILTLSSPRLDRSSRPQPSEGEQMPHCTGE